MATQGTLGQTQCRPAYTVKGKSVYWAYHTHHEATAGAASSVRGLRKRKQFAGSYTASSERIPAKRSLTDHGPLDHPGEPRRYPALAQGF